MPTFLRLVPDFAPGELVKTEAGFGHESVEARLRRRLPLKPRRSALADRGAVGGMLMLILLVPTFLMVVERPTPKGIYVRPLFKEQTETIQGTELAILVSVQRYKSSIRILVNGHEVRDDDLSSALKVELARRANPVVYVEGDASLSFAEVISVVDTVSSVQGIPVLLTPKLRRELTAR